MLNIFCGHRDELFTNDFVSFPFLMKANSREYGKKTTHCVLMKWISAAHFHQFLFSIIIIDVHKTPLQVLLPYCSLRLAHIPNSIRAPKLKPWFMEIKSLKFFQLMQSTAGCFVDIYFRNCNGQLLRLSDRYIPFPATVLRSAITIHCSSVLISSGDLYIRYNSAARLLLPSVVAFADAQEIKWEP